MEHHIAEQVVAALINNAYGKIANNLLLIMRECTEEEFSAYRRGTGRAMGYLLDIIGPILRQHPDLEPEEWKGPYEESEGVIPLQFNTSGRPMERSIAEQVLAALKDASLTVTTTLALIEKECTEEEVVAYREAAETAMGYISRDLIEPILRQHPDLTPEEVK
jgi:hypothetical protein